jgi:hypothetical protein
MGITLLLYQMLPILVTDQVAEKFMAEIEIPSAASKEPQFLPRFFILANPGEKYLPNMSELGGK